MLSSYEVYKLMESLHHDVNDIEEGSLQELIEEYDYYTLEYINLNEIEQVHTYTDEDYIEDYLQMNIKTMPPIVLGFYDDGSYRYIDGGHRIETARKKGLSKIASYVGYKGASKYEN